MRNCPLEITHVLLQKDYCLEVIHPRWIDSLRDHLFAICVFFMLHDNHPMNWPMDWVIWPDEVTQEASTRNKRITLYIDVGQKWDMFFLADWKTHSLLITFWNFLADSIGFSFGWHVCFVLYSRTSFPHGREPLRCYGSSLFLNFSRNVIINGNQRNWFDNPAL